MAVAQTKVSGKTPKSADNASRAHVAARQQTTPASNAAPTVNSAFELAGNLATQRLLRAAASAGGDDLEIATHAGLTAGSVEGGGVASSHEADTAAAEAEARRAAARGLAGSPQPKVEGGRLDAASAAHLSGVYGRSVSDVLFQRESGVARSRGADAVTIGNEVHLAAGVRLSAGLAAHEVAHAVQQTGGGSGLRPLAPQPLLRKPGDPEPSGDEPLDPFVTGWSVVPSGVLLARTDDKRLAIIPLRDAVYVPDEATAARFDPRVPKTPGTAPVFGVPAIGAAGTRIVPAGRRTAVIIDAGGGVGVSTGMYLSQFAGALQSVGVDAAAELFIIPIHAHSDHVDKIVNLISTYRIPPTNILIPRGLGSISSMRDVMEALTTGAQSDASATGTLLRSLGYGETWRPTPIKDVGTGPEVIRLVHKAPGGVRIELVALRAAITTAAATGRGVDLASYLGRITHPDGTVTGVLGDLRLADLETFKAAMERERPGSWAEFWSGVTRLSGFSHHVGRLAAGDVVGAMSLLQETLLRTGKLEIIEQTNLGQFGRARADTLEQAARIGATVTTAEAPPTGAPTAATPTSGVVATGTAVTARGPAAR